MTKQFVERYERFMEEKPDDDKEALLIDARHSEHNTLAAVVHLNQPERQQPNNVKERV